MTVARMHKQRTVQRGAHKPRFSKQKLTWRGTTKYGMPTITSINPNTAVSVTGPDVTMVVTGTGFSAGITKITWDGIDEPTTVISATQCSTLVRPSTALSPKVAVVKVRNGEFLSTGSQNFTLT
jgi:hypothetical protein